jgi:ubiquinone/menaquinone biosynthesis C-methylase UbiE/DNA-binding MarR family transcriptional regulator
MVTALSIFRAIADPTRLRVLALIRAMELSVGELAQVLGQSQPRVSRHVKILADAGLAERRKEGAWVFIRVGLGERTAALFDAIDRLASDDDRRLFESDAARLAAVRDDRVAAAERYFAQRAEEWDAIRSLHIADGEVEEAMAQALAGRPLGALVDIGTGTGRMLELFGTRASSAVGIDRSPEMLRLARVRLGAAGVTHGEVRQGDMYGLDLDDGSADTVLLHQVLHFAQQPAAAIAEAARVLAPGGRLLIVDFAPHDREELRIRDAHARLGFGDEDVAGWIAAAGLKGGAIDHLSGGALTVTLWRGEKPGRNPELH